VVVDRGGEEGGVLVLADQREPEDVGVVLGLLRDVGHLVAGMGDLAYADHANLQLNLLLVARMERSEIRVRSPRIPLRSIARRRRA
jgi:hypothetical protein